jgi:hypothetical protein
MRIAAKRGTPAARDAGDPLRAVASARCTTPSVCRTCAASVSSAGCGCRRRRSAGRQRRTMTASRLGPGRRNVDFAGPCAHRLPASARAREPARPQGDGEGDRPDQPGEVLELTVLCAAGSAPASARRTRWLQRYVEEHEDVTLEEAAMAASWLASLGGARPAEAVRTIRAMVDRTHLFHGRPQR